MSDLAKDILSDLAETIAVIQERTKDLKTADDFLSDDAAIMLYDSVVMRLQVAGELVKKLIKLAPDVPVRFPKTDWSSIIKMRDKISHHYLDLDSEIIFDICQRHLPSLEAAVARMLDE
ncbi:MAG: DUF86 domain-containing protein [Campylobacterales bacterium]